MIPRVIHRMWLGGEEPEWTRPFRDTWLLPGWMIRTWDDDTVETMFPLRNQDIYDEAAKICPNHVGQLRSDVLRYEILHRHGGVYIDHDFECLRPFDPLLEGVSCFTAWEIQDRSLANGFMGAEIGHGFIDTLIRRLPESVRVRRGKFKPNQISGPGHMNRVWKLGHEDVVAFPQSQFFPYGFAEIKSHNPGELWPEEAYAVHHWNNRRREKGVPAQCS